MLKKSKTISKKPIRDILTSKVISVSPTTPFSEAVSLMQNKKISCLVVVENKRPVGIFTERDFVMALNDGLQSQDLEIKEVMSKPVLTAGEDMQVYEACDLLLENMIRHLVVVKRSGKIAGVVSLSNITNNIGLQYFVELKDVSKIMAKNVVAIEKKDHVSLVISKMAKHSISCIVVEEGGRPIGVLTERDIVNLFREHGNPSATEVGKVMSSPVISIPPDTPVFEADRIMKQNNIRRLIVVDSEGMITGLITQSDIVKRLEERYVEFLKRILREKEVILEETKKKLSEKIVLENILRSSTDQAIIATDLDFHIIYFNPVAEKIYGYKVEDVINKQVMKIHKLEKVESFRLNKSIATVAKGGIHEYTFKQKKNGDEHYFESKVTGIWNMDGKLAGYVLMTQDVTKRKRAEKNLKQTVDDLENWQRLSVGRELKMIELKTEVEDLKKELQRYKSV